MWPRGTALSTWSARAGGGGNGTALENHGPCAAAAGGAGAAGPQRRLLVAESGEQRLARGGAEEAVRQVETVHGVLGVERRPAVFRRDARRGELARQRRPTHAGR